MVIAQLSKPATGTPPADMDVHCLLSKLPYQKMLSDLFISNDREVLQLPNIPYVTRAYEEFFMREPLSSSERLCAKNDLCECMFIDPESSFTAVEFLLPGERPPPTPHLCVVCCRYGPGLYGLCFSDCHTGRSPSSSTTTSCSTSRTLGG